eukprot:CAMPEP_0181292296 /NCGR_PEP_ID=MMETSP1101-20121128/2429_1 /TAXON_ID=46948 /ORGANISM="Rhodomonas abbreviata, Strain Caron Lab Isolate" /LENGTH=119 /DNA_ID=CAMNT_0023396753 /DNA_START=396 /DNA_END=752 /DNA_ORIENTATION=+
MPNDMSDSNVEPQRYCPTCHQQVFEIMGGSGTRGLPLIAPGRETPPSCQMTGRAVTFSLVEAAESLQDDDEGVVEEGRAVERLDEFLRGALPAPPHPPPPSSSPLGRFGVAQSGDTVPV